MLARLCFLAALLGSATGLNENTTTLQDINEVIILTKKIAPFSSPTDMVNQRGSNELPTSGAIDSVGAPRPPPHARNGAANSCSTERQGEGDVGTE